MRNIDHIRTQFPALSKVQNKEPVTYFDGPGGTQTPSSVVEAISSYMLNHNANLGGSFDSSVETVALCQQTRDLLADFLNARANEISFGQNMTSLTFSFSRALANEWKFGDNIILSSLDHDANITPWLLAAKEKGVNVHLLPYYAKAGTITPEHLLPYLNKRTKLVAITAASNLLGSHVNVTKVCELAHSVNALVFIDAVHYAPHHSIDVQKWNCDFLVCSAYKFFGPHLGILWGKEEHMQRLTPYKIAPAPSTPPHCWETGTQNFAAIAGTKAALDYILSIGGPNNKCFKTSYQWITEHEQTLKTHFLNKLTAFPEITLHGFDTADNRTATFALTHATLSPKQWASSLAAKGIYTWNGHMYAPKLMCNLGLKEDSGVLRVGLMHYNTIEEIDRFFLKSESCRLLR